MIDEIKAYLYENDIVDSTNDIIEIIQIGYYVYMIVTNEIVTDCNGVQSNKQYMLSF